ncbi:DUF2797 domain-containing protein [Streptomyces europaeiscabiei]|uniref:DUF2797 domain-containing protein n=1 Tax=Streptomyces europaeiscabiei TaxID=146819 RepID=A0ABU4NJT7_9ACTN|nr:DUF2797 domain-containing protein [Streptomyces europaeiscabiei]MDX3544841.1 DUF2797 domain-containing protein [Streptomyces europaeiscabiei]MDX3554529.1 DUF2797 domain-containing protein [Streptomyces europaeiscabiei]MDX3702569.1 DUF2797 domain-containing protein [Streptomyces europaeiscabiei]MDX3862381.1 DUF2797 domain-containing protein [Streptomyces europaeiscabiei]MDX3870533.1 DUF2797 domain-containing protein [Streptomyces europaeiscabiei]
MARVWRCTGLRWGADGPLLEWAGGRGSPLPQGKAVAFAVVSEGRRTCAGARGNSCPLRAGVPGRSTGGRCEECARLDRAHSVAADTIADDPRPYHVYLAWFGPGMVKVGITAVERGPARLLEQGAVSFGWLGRGPLMAARRAEEVLRAALKVPDRIPYAEKRAVRAGLPPAEERAGELAVLHGRALGLAGWPESLEPVPFQAVDHFEVFGLDGLPAADGVVSELVAGGAVGGAVLAVAGPDVHLATGRGVVVLDTRLMTGWELTAPVGVGEGARAHGALTVPVREMKSPGDGSVQDGLF